MSNTIIEELYRQAATATLTHRVERQAELDAQAASDRVSALAELRSLALEVSGEPAEAQKALAALVSATIGISGGCPVAELPERTKDLLRQAAACGAFSPQWTLALSFFGDFSGLTESPPALKAAQASWWAAEEYRRKTAG